MPEEINRIAVDHLSTHLLAPTQKAMQQLTKEGLTDRAYFTGDVMLDSASRALGVHGPAHSLHSSPGTARRHPIGSIANRQKRSVAANMRSRQYTEHITLTKRSD